VKQLEQGQTVLVRLTGAAAVAARVDSVSADEASLILLTPPMRPPATGQSCAVEVTVDGGILTLATRVTDHDGRTAMRVAPDSSATHAPSVQRRDFVRVDASVPVVVRDGGPDGPGREARSVNVSGGGLLLTGIGHLDAGDFAWVALDLGDGSAPIEALVTVVREDPSGTCAVRIASISARDEQRIVRFSFTRQQQQARIAREV
jgi:c-di-GMP-binding flagellar brake protein YcgR